MTGARIPVLVRFPAELLERIDALTMPGRKRTATIVALIEEAIGASATLSEGKAAATKLKRIALVLQSDEKEPHPREED